MRHPGWLNKILGRSKPAPEQPEPAPGHLLEIATPQPEQSRLPTFRKASSRTRPRDTQVETLRARVRGAFSPSRPVVDSELYSGRTRLLKSLISAVEDSNMHVIIFGTRGIGKTSTLHVLNAMARKARYIVHYGSCGQNVTFAELFGAVLSDIPLLFHQDYDPVANEVEEGLSFADLYGDEPITVPMLSEAFSRISGTQVLVILDEFDRVEDGNMRRLVAELIKNLSDRAAPVQLVIAGVAQNIDEIVEHIPSIRRNILPIRVPNMEDAEARELIGRGADRSGLRFTDEARERIVELALGLPYIASLLAHHASLVALDARRKTITAPDVAAAVEQSVNEIELRLNPALVRVATHAADSGEGELLVALARRSLECGGTFTLRNADEARAIDGLRFGKALIRRSDADRADEVCFVEDGLPVYLWMRAALVSSEAPPILKAVVPE